MSSNKLGNAIFDGLSGQPAEVVRARLHGVAQTMIDVPTLASHLANQLLPGMVALSITNPDPVVSELHARVESIAGAEGATAALREARLLLATTQPSRSSRRTGPRLVAGPADRVTSLQIDKRLREARGPIARILSGKGKPDGSDESISTTSAMQWLRATLLTREPARRTSTPQYSPHGTNFARYSKHPIGIRSSVRRDLLCKRPYPRRAQRRPPDEPAFV